MDSPILKTEVDFLSCKSPKYEEKIIGKKVYLKLSHFPSRKLLHKMIWDTIETKNRNASRNYRLQRYRPTEYQVGDMFWAKIRGYPFWPCMLSTDPFTGMYLKYSGTAKSSKSYHVQFFGRGYYRSWVSEASMLKYEGREQYLEIVKYGPENPWKCHRPSKDYVITATFLPSWNLSVIQAEQAFRLSLEQRREQYTFHYMYRMRGKEYSVSKMVQRIRNQLLNVQEDDISLVDSDGESQTDLRAKRKAKPDRGSFEVFYNRHARLVEEDHPDWKMSLVLSHLEEKWSQMSAGERRRYVTRVEPIANSLVHNRTKFDDSRSQRQAGLKRMVKIDPESLQLQISRLAKVISDFDIKLECKEDDNEKTVLKFSQGSMHADSHDKVGSNVKEMQSIFDSVEKVCIACKETVETSYISCSEKTCGLYYHSMCVSHLKETEVSESEFLCPLHVCSSCKGKGEYIPLIQCELCPAAYHASELCLAAGSHLTSLSSMVCCTHLRAAPHCSKTAKISTKKCLHCGRGAKLNSCRRCPASFCADCSQGNISQTSAVSVSTSKRCGTNWLCTNCQLGKRPLYGDIIWAKVNFFKWWPAEICHPRHIPVKCQLKTWPVGKFPVRFFGSNDFSWTHEGRVLAYHRVHSGLDKGYNSGHLSELYVKALQEAEAAQQFCANFRQTFCNNEDMKTFFTVCKANNNS